MGWESFCVVGFDLGPLLQGRTRILHLQYFFKYVLTYFLHLNNYLVTFLQNTICREQLFCSFLLSASEFLSNMLFNYHLLYFCTALSLIIMLSSHYHVKSKTLSQLTQCPFTETLLLFRYDDRISTFATWPKSRPIPAQRYVKAGFHYSGEGDKVICPWCNLNLIEWESYDMPMEEHQKHFLYCAFVLMLNPFLNYHLL